MLIRIHIILSIWAACSHAVNHAIFKACYNVTVCKDLRKGSETTTFQLPDDLNTFTVSEDTVIGKLSKKGPHKFFKLKIQLLEHNKVRLQLEEDDNKIQRYQLKDILHPDIPKSITPETKVDKDKNTLSITPQDATTGNQSVIIYKSEDSSLLNVTFLYGQHVMVALDGKDIVMDYDDGNEKRDIGFTVLFNEAQKLYGLHHHAYDLELPDTTIQTKDGKYISEPFRLRNSDTAHFEANSPMALYGSVPAIYGHSESSTAGIFLHNAAEQWVDIHYEHNGSPSAHFMVDSGSFDLFVMLGPDTENVVQQFTELTGRAHMPQLWTLGYHQSRWSYYSKEEVLEVVKQMKQNDFPMDAIWLDIDYTDEKKYFTWNENFTGKDNNGVKEMLKALGHDGRKLVTIIDPHIKQDESYEIYTEGREGNFFVKKYKNGSDFVGECWPGPSSYVDFLNPVARKYYADHYSDKNFHHGHPEVLAGIWNDMNEPSVFDDKNEWSMPSNLWHRSKDGSDVDVKHRDIHNIYGFLHTMSTHQGLMDRDNNGRRPFILTRSHFAGSQRFAAMWTGDNTADWPHLKNSYSECMLSNLMGHVFCGADVPGFFGDPDPEFAYRAYQAAIWLPFFRGHADKNTKPREPYRYDPEVQKIIRTAIKMRYKHIPTWYTLFYEHTLTGAPLIRPLFYHYPGTVNRNEYVMLGRDILATPVFEPGNKTMEVHFPDSGTELWYRADDNSFQVYLGGTTVKIEVEATTSPVFYRSGSIIVRQERDVSSTAEFDKLPIALYVNCDKEGAATGRFYHDDGISFNYQKEKENKHLYVEFSYNKNDGLAVRKVPGDDDQDHEGLEVFVDKIIYNMRKTADTYVSTHHEADENGNLLRSISITQALKNNTQVVFKLR